jgi:hypothetical protein
VRRGAPPARHQGPVLTTRQQHHQETDPGRDQAARGTRHSEPGHGQLVGRGEGVVRKQLANELGDTEELVSEQLVNELRDCIAAARATTSPSSADAPDRGDAQAADATKALRDCTSAAARTTTSRLGKDAPKKLSAATTPSAAEREFPQT